jgi:hypothetical protein
VRGQPLRGFKSHRHHLPGHLTSESVRASRRMRLALPGF